MKNKVDLEVSVPYAISNKNDITKAISPYIISIGDKDFNIIINEEDILNKKVITLENK